MIWYLVTLAVISTIAYFVGKTNYNKEEFKDRIFPEDAALLELGKVREQLASKEKELDIWKLQAANAEAGWQAEKIKNDTIVSQKQSVLVRTGAIIENIVPLLNELPYDSKNLHHLGQPIDYLYFDYDTPSITFIEVKSGNAKESKRQKLIKNVIEKGLIHYDLLQVTDKGIEVKRKV